MDNAILKKKLSTFRTTTGKLTRVSDDVLIEVIKTWEQWPGTSSDMAKDLGLTMRQLVILVEKAKKRIRDDGLLVEEFKEVKVVPSGTGEMVGPIEVSWDSGKVIRFTQVEQLVDFLKKVA
jgi:hypothetical protein